MYLQIFGRHNPCVRHRRRKCQRVCEQKQKWAINTYTKYSYYNRLKCYQSTDKHKHTLTRLQSLSRRRRRRQKNGEKMGSLKIYLSFFFHLLTIWASAEWKIDRKWKKIKTVETTLGAAWSPSSLYLFWNFQFCSRRVVGVLAFVSLSIPIV